jgi:hypothetical protein
MLARQPDAVVTTDQVRETTPNDFLRLTFVQAGVAVTTPNKPGSLRAFVTATAFYEPPVAPKDFPQYSGLVNDDACGDALRASASGVNECGTGDVAECFRGDSARSWDRAEGV